MGRERAGRGGALRVAALTWAAVVVLADAMASAEPVPGWSFMTWSASPAAVRAAAETARLGIISASADEAAMFGLAPSTVPFALHADLYGQTAVAYPVFRDDALIAVRFVVTEPATRCHAVLDGLAGDFGPGTPDQRGFANVNWPTTERFGLTVVVTPDSCWPLFYKPGL
jgi:hypothetical protein